MIALYYKHYFDSHYLYFENVSNGCDYCVVFFCCRFPLSRNREGGDSSTRLVPNKPLSPNNQLPMNLAVEHFLISELLLYIGKQIGTGSDATLYL